MYADDTHLTFAAKTVPNIDSNLNEDLSRVNNWLTANKLTLNKSKTEFMLIGSRQRLSAFDTSPSLEIDGAPVSPVTFTKSLGVYIDQNLSWNVHVNNLCKKIAAGIGVIKRSRDFVSFDTLQYMYSSYVQPRHTLITVVRFGVAATKHYLLSFRNSKILSINLAGENWINKD